MRHATIKSKALRLFFIYLHVRGQKSTKLQRSLLPQSQTVTSTVAVKWKTSISSCVSPEIIPNCLLFQAVLRTPQHHQPLLHRAVLTELLSPILLQHRLLAYCTNGVHRRGRSSQHMQETEGKGKKKSTTPNPDAMLFKAAQFPQTSFY